MKERDGIPVRDRAREKQVIASFSKRARGMGVDPVLAEVLSELLVTGAVKVQKTGADKDLAGKKALVVGGAGRMGAWLCRRLANRGAEVRVWDPRGKLEGYENVQSLQEHASRADIVVVASPLGACPEDLRKVLDARPRGLVFDICSVKSHISGLLRKAAASGVTVASAHPMFGPTAPSPRGLNILLCDCGSREGVEAATKLFAGTGANVVRVDLEKHDELMAYVLGLPHLAALMFSGTLLRSGKELGQLTAVQGPSFGKMLRISHALSRESVRVYHDIQALNPGTKDMLEAAKAAINDVEKASLAKDHTRFRRIMESNKEYLEVG
ncbi:MAG: hypothetical protein A3K67_01025 [Euryarchaeota archaeon RBG_16_62_10]|nr:MAG: hypothetical protein A3K67_01025 [Euryarchaeota archaeon RBG_16_62_10]